MVERKLRWNRFTNTGLQEILRHRYIVAIVNELREIDRIQQRFIEQMMPLDDITFLLDYSIPSSNGLHCKIFSFSSDQEKIENPNKIYANSVQFRRDRNLGEFKEERLIAYAERLSS